MRLLHFVYPSCILAAYFIFNCIYWESSGALVYGEMLDYSKNTGKAIGLALSAVFIASPVIQLAWFFMFLLRKKLATRSDDDQHPSYELAEHNSSS